MGNDDDDDDDDDNNNNNNKSGNSNHRGNWNFLKVIHLSNILEKHEIRKLNKTAILNTARILGKVLI